MIPNTIEHDIVIDAPIDTVWRIVTEPAYITQWFSNEVELNTEPGSRSVLTFGEPGDEKVQPFFVETYEPTSNFAFRWCHENSDDPSTKSLLVEFELTADGDTTRLRMTESGYDQRDDQAMYDDHIQGWNVIVPKLVNAAKARV